MLNKKLISLILVILVLLLIFNPDGLQSIYAHIKYYFYNGKTFSNFENLYGPTAITHIPNPIPTSYQKYEKGSKSRLAILLSNDDSAWLGLAHGLKSMGIPFIITKDYQEALLHKVIYVYPSLPSAVLANLRNHNGTVIIQTLDDSVNSGLGLKKTAFSPTVTTLHFNTKLPITAEFNDPNEQTIKIGNTSDEPGNAYAYLNPTGIPIATYENTKPGIIQIAYLQNKLYMFGIDLGRLLLIGYDNRQNEISRSYVDAFEPSLDVLLRLLKNIYLEGQTDAVTLRTVPYGKSLAVIFTHDLDNQQSTFNALTYADFEKSHGIKATYFMQTKYIRDWNDKPFFNPISIENLKALINKGMEIGSHSVSHSLQFDHFPIGTGKEAYPTYHPYVQNASSTLDGTVLGELRVSRFLLEHFLPLSIVSFRPGYLKNPIALPQALLATNYLYSSSVTANDSLTHFTISTKL